MTENAESNTCNVQDAGPDPLRLARAAAVSGYCRIRYRAIRVKSFVVQKSQARLGPAWPISLDTRFKEHNEIVT